MDAQFLLEEKEMLNQEGQRRTLTESLHEMFEVLAIFLGLVALAVFLKWVVFGPDNLFILFFYWLGATGIAGTGWALTTERNTSEH